MDEEKLNDVGFIKCPICGKMFIPAPFHVYKIRQKWYLSVYSRLVCSWGCQRRWERKEGKYNERRCK